MMNKIIQTYATSSYVGPIIFYCIFKQNFPQVCHLHQNHFDHWRNLFFTSQSDKLQQQRQIDLSDIKSIEQTLILNKYEDLLIVWCDQLQDDYEMTRTLKELHNHVHLCLTADVLIDYIKTVNESYKIIIIVSGKYSHSTLSLFSTHNQIDSFFIFCKNNNQYEILTQEYPKKLVGIYTDYDTLFAVLYQRINYLLQQFSMFKVFSHSNRSMRDLEQESAGYLWYKLLRDTLLQMNRNEINDKQEFLDYCRSYYVNDSISLKAIENFEQSYTASNAIQWYTKNFFPFNFVNKALRTEDVTALYKLRYFIVNLCEQLRTIYVEEYEWYEELFQPFIVYRGLTLSEKDIETLIYSAGKYISTNGFLSTSRSRKVADQFAGNVLFEIKIALKSNIKYNTFAYIAYMSKIPDEEEVLFDLGAIFRIIDVRWEEEKWIVSITDALESNLPYLNNDYLNVEKEYAINLNVRPSIMYGLFLLQSGHCHKSIEYFNELLASATELNEREQNLLFNYLAHAYQNDSQPEESFSIVINGLLGEDGGDLLLSKVSQIRKKIRIGEQLSNQLRTISPEQYTELTDYMAYFYMLLGAIYANTDEFDFALDLYMMANSFIRVTNLQLIISLHLLLACLFYKKENYFLALKHGKQSIEFIEDLNSVDYQSKADAYEIVGDIYAENITYYPLAIEYLEKALELINSMFHYNSSRKANILLKLCSLYEETTEIEKAVKYGVESLEIFEKCAIEGSFRKQLTESFWIFPYIAKSIATLAISIEDLDTAIHMYQKMLKYKNDNKYIILHLYTYKNELMNMDFNEQIGICYYKQNKFDLAAAHFSLALNTPSTVTFSNEHTRLAVLNMKIGWCFEKTCQYELALQHYKISLEMSENDGSTDNDTITRLYLRTADMYKCMNQKKMAYDYYIKGVKMRDEVDSTDKRQMIAFHGELVKYCHENHLYELNIYHFERVLDLGKQLKDLVLVRTVCPLLANLHAKYMEQYDIAIKYIKEGIDTCRLVVPCDQREMEKLAQALKMYQEMQHMRLHELTGVACVENI